MMATKKRLIDANALKDKFLYLRKMWSETEIVLTINDAKTVDTVEVVRCKDCFANGCCSVQDALDMGDEGYCPKGRKEN